MFLNNSNSQHNNSIMTTAVATTATAITKSRYRPSQSAPATRKQTQEYQSNKKLYINRRMKILSTILAVVVIGFCLFQYSSSLAQAQEMTTSSIMAGTTFESTRQQEAQQQQSIASQQSAALVTTTTSLTTTEMPTNLDNKMTTITIFKIQKQALHNSTSENSKERSWLIDNKSDQISTSRSVELDNSTTTTSSSLANRTTLSPSPSPSPSPALPPTVASSSRAPAVLRPSIEEVASKLSRKHLNLEHDNWRLKESPSSSLPPQQRSADVNKLTKLLTAEDGSAGLAPTIVEAEQDLQLPQVGTSTVTTSSSSSSDASQQQQQSSPGSSAGIFSTPLSKPTSDGHQREHYLHIDSVVTSPAAASNQPKSRQSGSRRKKANFFVTGEAYELSQCHQYLRIYNAPSTTTTTTNSGSLTGGLYQMISNQQLPCSCEMRPIAFPVDLQASNTEQSLPVAPPPTSWLSCDYVQLVGGYLQPLQSSTNNRAGGGGGSGGDTWDMGNNNHQDGGGGAAIQVTRFSQRNSGLQTLHAQKFLNLQLSNLKSIDLSDNRIRQIKMDAFHGLEQSLENLNLANNLLGDSRAISPDLNLQKDQQLKSKLIFYTDEFNRLRKLKWLSLRNNRINQLDSTIFTRHSQNHPASFIQVDSTSGSNLREPTQQQQQQQQLKDLQQDNGKITGELVYLDLSENILKTVPSDAIELLNKLQTLNLKGNKIVQLDQSSKFPKSLKYLDLSENLIKIIRNCDLIDLPDLIELNLSHNQLSQLDKTAFLSASSSSSVSSLLSATVSSTLKSHQIQVQNANANANANANSDASASSLLSSSLNNLIVSDRSSGGSPASGLDFDIRRDSWKDEQARLVSSTNEETKLTGMVADLLSLDANRGRESASDTRTRTRRDVISVGGVGSPFIIDDDDDLDADESSQSSQFAAAAAAAGKQMNLDQQTLADEDSQRGSEFNSTIRLNLAYNYFTSLPGDSLVKFTNLKYLDISYNRIRYLDSNYLCSIYNLVENLQELDLSGNLLIIPQTNNSTAVTTNKTPSLPAESAYTVPSGRQLNRLFGCLQKLERLSLGTNRLSSPASQLIKRSQSLADTAGGGGAADEDDAFSSRASSGNNSPDRLHVKFGDNYGSRYLNQLDLSDNQLRTMPLIEQVFQQPFASLINYNNNNNNNNNSRAAINGTLPTIDQQQQYQLNQWMASRVYLVDLNLSYNYIDRLEERDFDHLFSLRHLSFDYNRLSSLPSKLMRKFTSLDRASFEGNRLDSIEPLNELFERSIRTLRYLNLANNRLTVWPNIIKVLYENPLRQNMEYRQNSQPLQMDSEDKQASALQFSLEELNLEGNLLTSGNLSSLFDQFVYMKSLRHLNLSQNLLNRVRSEWFKYANNNLRTLSLAGNKINTLDLGSFAFNQLNELQELNLGYNLLKELKRKTFDSLPKLRELDLSHNFIHTINSETFHQMNMMQKLQLSNNKLTSWKCEYFSNLCNSISGNINADLNALLEPIMSQHNTDISSESPAARQQQQQQHQPVSSLIELDLSHNSLSQLRVNSISVHTKLEKLNLAHNKLSYIPHDLFKANIFDSRTGRQIQLVSSLKWLNLAHNRIQTVDNINLRPLRNLISLDLSHNELQTLGFDVIQIDHNGDDDGANNKRNVIVHNNSNNFTNLMIDINDYNNSNNNNSDGNQRQSQPNRQPKMMQQQQQQQQHLIGNGLPALGKLRHLNLSNNQLIQVNQSLLHELSPFVLLNLDLSYNYLESDSLPYGFYAKISGPSAGKNQQQPNNNNYDLVFTLKLESLNLSHNRLNEFPSDLLENHHISMETCNLAHNRIQTLVPNSNILIQIKSLNLNFNPLNRESNELILYEHKSARQLNLAATRLYAIKELSQQLTNLDRTSSSSSQQYHQQKHRLLANQTSQLDLIRSISKPIDAPYVQHLNLSSNQLVWLAANIFERMHSLQTLDLNNNQLTRLHLLTNQLAPLSASLEGLYLASNLFTSIDLTDFSQLTRLKHLDLSSLLSLQKLNCRFLSKLTTLKSLRLFNFPQVRQNLNNILMNLQHRQQQQQQQQQQDSHASSTSERISRKLQQELLMSTIGQHCFRDELLLFESNGDYLPVKWFNLELLELELFSAFDEDSMKNAIVNGKSGAGFELQDELAQLIGPQTRHITLFGLNLTNLAADSLLGITNKQLDLKISYTSLNQLPLEQVLNGISKRTKLNLDFRNNNIQSMDVKSLQILDELQMNNQILQKGDHSSLRLASNPMRCDCQTRPLWLWLNQRWSSNIDTQPQNQLEDHHLGSSSPADMILQSSLGSSANNWLKFSSSVSQTSDIKCHYPAKLRGKLAQYVSYHDLVCKGSHSSPHQTVVSTTGSQSIGRQSRKRNETKLSSDSMSYYLKGDSPPGDFEDDSSSGLGDSLADYWDNSDSGTLDGATQATLVKVTKFNRFPSLIFNQSSMIYLQTIPVPFISDNQQQQDVVSNEDIDFELDDSSMNDQNLAATNRVVGKRDGNSLPVYPILVNIGTDKQQTVNTKYSKHRPNTQQRHSSYDTLSTLKQFKSAHHYHSGGGGQRQALLTDFDVYILTIMSIAMSIMSFIIIAICLFKYKMDRSDKERILADHGKMLMSQALFNINNHAFNHQSFKPAGNNDGGNSSKSSSSKQKSSSKTKSSSSSSSSKSSSNNKNNTPPANKRTMNLNQQTTTVAAAAAAALKLNRNNNQMISNCKVLMPMQPPRDIVQPNSIGMPAGAAQNFLMRSPTVRRMQGLATNASDWFKYTLRAYPSNAAMHRGQRRRRLFLGDTVPVVTQLTTGKQGIEERLAEANEEPGSPATLAVGCPQHAFRAVDKLRKDCKGAAATATVTCSSGNEVIEETCLHCARLLATIQRTKVQYLIGGSSNESASNAPAPAAASAAAAKQQHQLNEVRSQSVRNHRDNQDGCFVPPSVIRALAEQLDQANAESNNAALGRLEKHHQSRSNREESAASIEAYYKREQRGFRSMRSFGVVDRRQEEEEERDQQQQQQQQQQGNTMSKLVESQIGAKGPKEGSQIPSIDVIGRFHYQSDSQVDTPTPYDARCSSMLGGSSQMDGSEDTNGHYNRDGVFILVPDDDDDAGDNSSNEGREPVSVLLNNNQKDNKKKGQQLHCNETILQSNTSQDVECRLTDQREESIRMQDECSRTSSPIAYGFMRNSGPSSLTSSSATHLNPQLDYSNRYQHAQSSAATTSHYNPTSSNNNNIDDNYSVVRKKYNYEHRHYQHKNVVGSLNNSDNHEEDQQQEQVIISRL